MNIGNDLNKQRDWDKAYREKGEIQSIVQPVPWVARRSQTHVAPPRADIGPCRWH